MALIGRIVEQDELGRLCESPRAEFAVVYGRRRVGKTTLVEETFQGNFAFKHAALSTLEKKPYTIAIDGNTKFLAGGGEGEPQYMSATEFNDYIEQCMGSGLGLNIIIKNGVAVEIGIWS